MNDIERKIIEQRTIEATKKGLMGTTGKLGIILKYLGEPIIEQTEGFLSEDFGCTSTTFDSLREEYTEGRSEDEIPTMDWHDELGHSVGDPTGYGWGEPKARVSVSTRRIGWIYQSLNNGINFDIKYMDASKELSARYENNVVFMEVKGELFAYVPGDWENKIKPLYEAAKKLEKKTVQVDFDRRIKEGEANKESWLEHMHKFWGF